MEGARTKKMVAETDAAKHVGLTFDMYVALQTSFGDIAQYLTEQGSAVYDKALARGFISQLLQNPLYEQTNLDLCDYSKAQGTAIIDDVLFQWQDQGTGHTATVVSSRLFMCNKLFVPKRLRRMMITGFYSAEC